jgi:hypothetical protein
VHSDIDVTQGALDMWVDQHALTIAGPVHAAWETDTGWPISRAPSGVETTVGSWYQPPTEEDPTP